MVATRRVSECFHTRIHVARQIARASLGLLVLIIIDEIVQSNLGRGRIAIHS